MELALKTKAIATMGGEQSLVEAARRGDDRAFEQLYELYRERVTAFINSKVRDHGRAEDISQEVFMAALRQLRSNERDIAFKPWLFTIAKNACIDEFRRSARGHEVPVETDDDFPTDQRGSLSVVPSPPAAIESKQRLTDLRGAFGGLSESHHRLLVMRELEGRSYDEIGNRLGMTRQMVESGLFRARRKLGEEYDELASGRRCEQVQTAIDSGVAIKIRQLGIKERRRLTQHLSHCQACRHQARLAGIDEALLKPRSIAARIAALLPFGGLGRWPWRRGGSTAARTHASGQLAASGATQAAGVAGSSITLGQAAAAALAIAGVGGGVAIAEHTHHTGSPMPSRTSHLAPKGHAGAAATGGVSSTSRSAGGRAGASAGAGSSRTLTGRSAVNSSTTGPAGAGADARPPGQSSPPAGQPPSGGSGPGTPRTAAPNTTSSSGGGAGNPLNTTINKGGQTVSKVSNPVKKITNPITKATKPVTAPVQKVLSSPPVKGVTAPVQKVLSSPPVKSVTTPVQKVAAPVLSSPPVKDVTAPVQKVLSSPPVKSVTTPVNKVAAPVLPPPPPVTQVTSTVGGTVKKVTSTTTTTTTTPAGGSGSSTATTPTLLPPVKTVLGGL